MSEEATGATPTGENPGANPGGGSDPRESHLGDKGTELLREMRQQLKDQAAELNALKSRNQTDDDKAAQAEKDRLAKVEADRIAAENKDKSALELLERRLEEEREARLKTEREMSDRLIREKFLDTAKSAGIRDETAAKDLYALLKDELGDDTKTISEVIEASSKSRPHFFNQKRGTQGHGGAEGSSDGGPKYTAEESMFAKALNVPIEDYVKSRDGKTETK